MYECGCAFGCVHVCVCLCVCVCVCVCMCVVVVVVGGGVTGAGYRLGQSGKKPTAAALAWRRWRRSEFRSSWSSPTHGCARGSATVPVRPHALQLPPTCDSPLAPCSNPLTQSPARNRLSKLVACGGSDGNGSVYMLHNVATRCRELGGAAFSCGPDSEKLPFCCGPALCRESTAAAGVLPSWGAPSCPQEPSTPLPATAAARGSSCQQAPTQPHPCKLCATSPASSVPPPAQGRCRRRSRCPPVWGGTWLSRD
jgi:hypothetical protein